MCQAESEVVNPVDLESAKERIERLDNPSVVAIALTPALIATATLFFLLIGLRYGCSELETYPFAADYCLGRELFVVRFLPWLVLFVFWTGSLDFAFRRKPLVLIGAYIIGITIHFVYFRLVFV